MHTVVGVARWALAAATLALAACGGSASPAMTPPGPGAPDGPAVRLVAENIAFDASELRARANQAFTIVVDNRDAVPHDVSIERSQGGQGGAARVFEGAVFTGPATRWYAVPALAPGEYTFVCEIHPNMTGRLVAG